jgi:putative PIG3 family NAD(P)H quinone oxidoreductase
MHAIQVAEDDKHSLLWTETAMPEYGRGEVLVRARASAVNRADLLQRIGRYPVPPGASPIMGLEVAGEIAKVGADVEGWSVGDRVCALLEGGGYAELVNVDQRMLLPVPDTLGFEEAAAIPEVFYTAFLNLYLEAGLQPGETVLIHAGASGVGTAAVQLCRESGNPVYATTSTPKLDRVRSLGATAVFDRLTESFRDRVREVTDGRGVDVILDPVGGSYLADNLDLLVPRGRLVLIGLLGGAKAEINLARLLMKRVRLIGSVLRSRSRDEKVAITEALRERVWPLVEDGRVAAVIDTVVDIKDAEKAHEMLQENRTVGKVVLRIDG